MKIIHLLAEELYQFTTQTDEKLFFVHAQDRLKVYISSRLDEDLRNKFHFFQIFLSLDSSHDVLEEVKNALYFKNKLISILPNLSLKRNETLLIANEWKDNKLYFSIERKGPKKGIAKALTITRAAKEINLNLTTKQLTQQIQDFLNQPQQQS